jgi:oligopeptide transport system substrate-binding protein
VPQRPSSSVRLLCAAVVALFLLASLAACDRLMQGVSGVTGGGGGTLRLAGASPDTLDPAVAQDVTSWTYILQIYSGLVRLDDQLRVQPDLASSWVLSDGNRTYTFTLRSDARFQDGRPITADDVKFSLERALDPATRSPVAGVYLGDIVGARERLAGQAASVSGVVVVDPHTVRITTVAPVSYFLSKLTYSTALVVDRANVATGPDWFKHPNGSGPFALKTWTDRGQIVLTRNPNYYGAASTLAEIDYYLGSEPPLTLYEQGKLDVVPVAIGDLPRVTDPQSGFHNQLVVTPMLSLWYLGLNVRQKPFDDPKVRLAFAYATNKRQIVNGLFRGSRTVANGILPPGLDGFDRTFSGIPFDPQKARQELSESSYGSAANLPPIILSVAPGNGQIAAGFAKMFQDTLGVKMSVVVLQDTFFSDLQQERLQMYYLGWVADYPDAQDFLEVLFGGSSDGNHTGYANPQVDHLLDQARVETSPQQRVALNQQAEKQIVADVPAIPLYNDTDYTLVRPTVSGLKITPMGIISFAGVRVSG